MPETRPYSPHKVAEAVKQRAGRFSGQIVNNGIRGVIIGLLNDVCGGDEGRYTVTEFLFGTVSTKELSDAHWFALKQWMMPGKEIVGAKEVWTGSSHMSDECDLILEAMGYNKPDQRELLKKNT